MPILYIRDELNQEWLPVVSELGAIPDVTFPIGVQDGQVLVYHSGSGVWTAGSSGGGTGSGSGGGDMYKSVYDQDNDGIVDDSERLGNQLPGYYSINTHTHSGSYAPVSHNHWGLYYSITDLSQSSGSGEVHWDNVTNKPSTYTPSSHTHVEADITDLVHDAVKIDGRDIDTSDTPTEGQTLVWNTFESKWKYDFSAGSGGGTGSSSSGSLPYFVPIFNETITGTGTDFNTVYEFIQSTLRVTWNGVRQDDTQFTEKVTHDGFTTGFTKSSDDSLIVDYHRPTTTGSLAGWWNGDANQIWGRDISSAAPSDDNVLAWNAGTNQWEPTAPSSSSSGSGGFTINKSMLFLYEDFLRSGSPYHNSLYNFPINGGLQDAGVSARNHPGVVNLKVSSSSGSSGYQLSTDPNAIYLLGGEEFIGVLDIDYNNAGLWGMFGFIKAAAWAFPYNGVWINVWGAVLGGMTAKAGVRSGTSTNYTVSVGTWYSVKIVLNNDVTRVDYYLYNAGGTELWTDYLTTNIPNTTSDSMGVGVFAGCANNLGVAYIMSKVDYIQASKSGLVR